MFSKRYRDYIRMNLILFIVWDILLTTGHIIALPIGIICAVVLAGLLIKVWRL